MADDYSDFIIQEPEKSIRTRLVERFKGQPFLMAGENHYQNYAIRLLFNLFKLNYVSCRIFNLSW